MTGSAEIITDDLRLLDKFLNPISLFVRISVSDEIKFLKASGSSQLLYESHFRIDSLLFF